MSNNEKFKGKYTVADGYAGGARPQYFTVDADDLVDEMSDSQLIEFYEETMQQAFEERIHPESDRVDEFVAWAREQLAKRNGE